MSSFVTQQRPARFFCLRNYRNRHAIEQAIKLTIFIYDLFYLNLIVNDSVKLKTIAAMTLVIAFDKRWWINLLF